MQTETIAPTPIIEYTPPATQELLEAAGRRREKFIELLLSRGLISQELANSDLLHRFRINPNTGRDALIHILVGDRNGGAHHLRTMMELELPGIEVASKLFDPAKVNAAGEPISYGKQKKRYRINQGVTDVGTFNPKLITTQDTDPISGVVTVYPKDGKEGEEGSTMFPSEWTSGQVIESIVEVANLTPVSYNDERHSFTHNGTVNGVKIRVITDESGAIITGCPYPRQGDN